MRALYEASRTLDSRQSVLCALGVVEGTGDGSPRDRPPKENDCSRRREKTAKRGCPSARGPCGSVRAVIERSTGRQVERREPMNALEPETKCSRRGWLTVRTGLAPELQQNDTS